MLKKTALFISVLFHPLFMPLAGMAILLFTGSYVSLLPLPAKKMILLLFATGTLLLPAIMIPLAYFRNELKMQKQDERTLPLILTFTFYILTYFLFLKIPVFSFMHNFMLGALFAVFLALIINLQWKISLHMIGLGGLTAFLLIIILTKQVNVYSWLLLSILASGLAGTARLYLNSHSPAQIYTGYFIGCISMTVCMLLMGN
jgi:hypothetical protein